MKKSIHPKIYNDSKVVCACGNSFVTESTVKEFSLDICNMCHPFYTGTQKFVDTEGRIEKFQKKVKVAQVKKEAAKSTKKVKRKVERTQKPEKKPTLKEMLGKSERN